MDIHTNPRHKRNILTANMPVYYAIHGNPGISIGFEYGRWAKRTGRFSSSMGVSYLWAGATTGGIKTNDIERSERIQVLYCSPGFFYHPARKPEGNFDLSFGLVGHIGKIKKNVIERHPYPGNYFYDFTESLYSALLGQMNICFPSRTHRAFILMIAGGFLPDGPSVPKGVFQIGLRFGARF